MAQLSFQLVAVAAAGLVVYRLAARAGVRLGLPAAVAIAAMLFMAVTATGSLRESWHTLDLQRTHSKTVTAAQGQATCTAVGVDGHFLGWIGARVPVRERYYMIVEDRLMGAGDICIRQLLFPRVQDRDLADARYVIFWGKVDPALLADLRRRGGKVERYPKREHVLVKLG